jgi:predicted dehydrogenase
VLIDIGVHLIDLAMHLTGHPKPLRVSAHTASSFGSPIKDYRFTEMWAGPPNEKGVFDVEDNAFGLVRFEGGMTLEISVTWAANLPDDSLPSGMTVLGDRGGAYFDVWGRKIAIATEEQGHLVDLKPQLPAGDPWPLAWKRQHELFAASVRDRSQPPATVEHGRCVQAVIDAMYRSSQQQREVEI